MHCNNKDSLDKHGYMFVKHSFQKPINLNQCRKLAFPTFEDSSCKHLILTWSFSFKFWACRPFDNVIG